MNALDALLAGIPRAEDAGETAAILARLAAAAGPHRASLTVQFDGARVRVRVVAASRRRSFRYAEPGDYVSDLAALGRLADRWGQGASSTGRVVWWAQLDAAPRIGA